MVPSMDCRTVRYVSVKCVAFYCTSFLTIPTLETKAYFGLWGSFFHGSFLLGTWLRENKKIAFIIREDADDDDDDDDDESVLPTTTTDRNVILR
jgi:hypothetical protein